MGKRVKWAEIEQELTELGKPALLQLKNHPDLYLQFQERLQGLVRATSGVGWGYGDTVSEIVEELEAQIGEAGE